MGTARAGGGSAFCRVDPSDSCVKQLSWGYVQQNLHVKSCGEDVQSKSASIQAPVKHIKTASQSRGRTRFATKASVNHETSQSMRIRGAVLETDCDWSRTLSDILGCKVWLKFENLQFTASFKERGALNRLSALTAEERKRGVIAMSAGNHAQGVAYHARRLGIPATIVMPVQHADGEGRQHARGTAPRSSCTARRWRKAPPSRASYGSEQRAHLHPPLRRSAGDRRPGHDRAGDAGRGAGDRHAGGADRRRRPDLRHGDRRQGAQARHPRDRRAGGSSIRPCTTPSRATSLPMRGDTLAEGIAVKAPGRSPQPIVRALVDDILLVSEPQIEHAVSLLINIEKTVVEGAGAAGLAAVLRAPRPVQGPQRRPRAVRRQYRHAPAGERADARAGARGPPDPARHRPRRPAGPACQGRQSARRRPAPISSRSTTSASSRTCRPRARCWSS